MKTDNGINIVDKVYTQQEIAAIVSPIAMKYGLARLYLFGSYARNEQTPESDLDFLVEKGKLRSLTEYCGLRLELEEAFSKSVDLVTSVGAKKSPKLYENIKKDEVLMYEQK